jgi:hypothetical protein
VWNLPPDDSPSPMDESPSETRRSPSRSPKGGRWKGSQRKKSFPRSDPQNEQYYPMELSRSQENFIEITLLVQAFLPVDFVFKRHI